MQHGSVARRSCGLRHNFRHPAKTSCKQRIEHDHEPYVRYDGGVQDCHTECHAHHMKNLTVLRHDNPCSDPFRQFHADSVLKEQEISEKDKDRAVD